MSSETLDRAWPLYGLTLAHGDLLLRVVTDEDALALAAILEEGIVPRGSERFMPRLLTNRAPTPAGRARDMLQYHWARRAELSPQQWTMPFTVVHEGMVIGSQSIASTEFRYTREVRTGSYLDVEHQRRGIGTRMRAMVLDLAFMHFNASGATSGYARGNHASSRVSARLGYAEDGVEQQVVNRNSVQMQRVRMTRDMWDTRRPDWLNDMAVTGTDRCHELLGAFER